MFWISNLYNLQRRNSVEKLRYLVLEDGQVFKGKAFGGDNFTIGQLVSNTSMSGYQEILSDNSYVLFVLT